MKRNSFTYFLLKNCVCFILCVIIFSNFSLVYSDDIDIDEQTIETVTAYDVNTKPLNLNARSCIILDRNNEQILYGKNEFNKVKMASTTKIMTATVIIENCNLSDIVEVSKKAAGTGGSRLGLKTGDKITVNDLLYGLMLCSGNDAAVCLAEFAAGSVNDFSVLMNNKAAELGLKNTHFESPHGLDSDGHYTTAYELATLANYAMKNSTFAKIVGTKTYTVTINGYPKKISNTNELLGNLNGVYGIKTGFTNGANRCLVTCCKRGDLDVISVVLGCDTKNFRTQDSIKLLEYAFANFEHVNIKSIVDDEFNKWKIDNLNCFSVNKGVSNDVALYFKDFENSIFTMNKKDVSNISVSITANKDLVAPVIKDSVVGVINVMLNDNVIASRDICIEKTIDKKSFQDYFLSFFSTPIDSFWNEVKSFYD